MFKTPYPWRYQNSFTLLRDGEVFFPCLFDHFEQATHFILIEIYLISSCTITQQLIDTLTRAKQRGVAVYLLCDDHGARNLSQADRNTLTQQDIHLCYYNPFYLHSPRRYLPRDHRITGQAAPISYTYPRFH